MNVTGEIANAAPTIYSTGSSRPAKKDEFAVTTFRKMFCKHFLCPSYRFREEMFDECAYHKPALVMWWARAFETKSFLDAVAFIEKVGDTESEKELEELISDYRRRNAETGSFAIRISGTRIFRLYSKMKSKSD